MKHFILFTALCFLSFPAFAQGVKADEAARLQLAEDMHDIWPIRPRIETALDAVASQFPEERRAEVKAALRKAIKFDQLEEESIKAMADIFTEEELTAMIAFYGSETGRAISAKTGDYELALRPVMTRMIDAAMLELRTGSAQ